MLSRFIPRRSEPVRFRDRLDAGRRLLDLLRSLHVRADLILTIPRGGLEVAEPVAQGLCLPLDALIARKIGAPGSPELAVGSVTRLGTIWNDDFLAMFDLSPADLEAARRRELDEVERRERDYRDARPAEPVRDRRVLLVDDGLATGATMAAAVDATQRAGAAAVLVAVPVAAEEAVHRLEQMGARVIVIATPSPFGAVGAFYEQFPPVPDARCMEILRRAAERESDGA